MFEMLLFFFFLFFFCHRIYSYRSTGTSVRARRLGRRDEIALKNSHSCKYRRTKTEIEKEMYPIPGQSKDEVNEKEEEPARVRTFYNRPTGFFSASVPLAGAQRSKIDI